MTTPTKKRRKRYPPKSDAAKARAAAKSKAFFAKHALKATEATIAAMKAGDQKAVQRHAKDARRLNRWMIHKRDIAAAFAALFDLRAARLALELAA
ncbi:hypothetical protein HOU02_gp152 [Caulobacter phage CcrBL9]|uniref:Uncharacterized protein n=1 Tax=Caulobacter phage CcrBL9 TaxID=2283270 RepID=A0A385ECR8_9CAUD|nr:hypothetical protein HOU02_gp033 [Caulobacter phage CcrBL9]YP_009810203.1 hypothetical protein HOU02_gp152 [Caulobacter phage CcrBL9]AXQ69057.1 hypothetical protein CcrBL9_gp033 [Caulobacter phage CcrBL9]AXQ69573.1 hypothetical protein CcrBL9_gp549 [Caulobacter phage CcrBL9]